MKRNLLTLFFVFLFLNVFATSKFWVGGASGNWSATTSWSLTSGGSSGAAVPLVNDDVYFDASSGAPNIIAYWIGASPVLNSLNITSCNVTFAIVPAATQSITANLTTSSAAYTLSASNASVAVGQFVYVYTGDGKIAFGNTVKTISGTALTLNSNPTGASTSAPTLAFVPTTSTSITTKTVTLNNANVNAYFTITVNGGVGNGTSTYDFSFLGTSTWTQSPFANGQSITLGASSGSNTVYVTGNSATNYFDGNNLGYISFVSPTSQTVWFNQSSIAGNGTNGGLAATAPTVNGWGAISPTKGIITLANSVNTSRVTFGGGGNSQGIILNPNVTLNITGNGSCTFNANAACQGIDASASGSKVILTSQNASILGITAGNIFFKPSTTINYLELNRPTLTFTLPQAITVNNLVVTAGTFATGANNVTLSGSGSATLAPNAILSINGGTTNFAGRPVTLQSTSVGTGKISAITGDNITTGLINASNVTVQRFIPNGRRTNRFLSHPFSGALSMSSLIDNIYVTGGNYLTGFDSTGTQSPSAFWYDNSLPIPAWIAFTSTSDASWTQYRGIRVLVRGDRSQPAALTGGNPTPNAVTLDMTGTVNTGNQNISVPTGYSVIGNPYPSSIALSTRLNATTNIGSQYWIWDANAGPSSGAYRTKIVGSSSATLPMCAAFVVDPAASTTINFVEGDKTTIDTVAVFRTSSSSGLIELQVLYNNYPADNMFVRLNNASNDNKDALDGGKLLNPEVNFYALSSDNKKLSLDTRPFAENKIIPLGFTATAANSFKIQVADYGINEEIYLKDKYLNVTTQLFAGSEYSFSVDPAIPATLGENRFELIMKTNSALPTTFLSIAAAQKNTGIEVIWNTANETNLNSYEVEESSDGINFTKSTTIAAKNAATNTYSWFDASIINGDNYYRIKSLEKNGTAKYSNIVKVKIGGKRSEFTVYPNPVKGGIINLQMSNVEQGIYAVKIYNNLGQGVANITINHNGGSATQTIDIGKSITPGTYSMHVSNGTTIITQTVIVE